MNEQPEKEDVVTFVGKLPDGSSILEHSDGRLERRRSQTDWTKAETLTDEDIEAAIADDPDWAGFKDIDWSKAELVFPTKKKKAISIRVDEDVLNFFKKGGEGYQKRMNAVLRSYVQQRSKPKKRA